MNYRPLIALLLIALFTIKTASANESGIDVKGLVIEKAWIAEAPPVSKVMAAYLTIKNPGSETIRIIRAESDFYSSIEFHETIHENGMASMIRHSSLNIPANDELTLKRGGAHLMLFNPVKQLKAGDSVIIKLITEDNNVKSISVPVKKSDFN